jgi:hypothetical protein
MIYVLCMKLVDVKHMKLVDVKYFSTTKSISFLFSCLYVSETCFYVNINIYDKKKLHLFL